MFRPLRSAWRSSPLCPLQKLMWHRFMNQRCCRRRRKVARVDWIYLDSLRDSKRVVSCPGLLTGCNINPDPHIESANNPPPTPAKTPTSSSTLNSPNRLKSIPQLKIQNWKSPNKRSINMTSSSISSLAKNRLRKPITRSTKNWMLPISPTKNLTISHRLRLIVRVSRKSKVRGAHKLWG